MVIINKEQLSTYTNQIIANLAIAHKLWLEFYEKNSDEPYVMGEYGGFYTELPTIYNVTFDKKIQSWECGTSCCRIGDLPRAFPIKRAHFNDVDEFSYTLFSRDIFTPIYFNTFEVDDLTKETKNNILNLIEDEFACWLDPFWNVASVNNRLMSYRFIWDFLFDENLTGTKEELVENYPKVVKILKGILEIIE